MNKSKNIKPQKNDLKTGQQKGGGSDWSDSFYSYFMSPADLSRYTLQYIDQAPMFHPLQFGRVFPTGTSGVTPTGVYLATETPATQAVNDKMVLPNAGLPAGTSPSGSNPASVLQPGTFPSSGTPTFVGPSNPSQLGTSGGGSASGQGGQGQGQAGGSNDSFIYNASTYPRIPLTPEYIGVSCGTASDPGIATLPFGASAAGLKRCQVRYSSTNSYGPGCEVCANAQETQPAIWTTPRQQSGGCCGSSDGFSGCCGGCSSSQTNSCQPCRQDPKYIAGSDYVPNTPQGSNFNQLGEYAKYGFETSMSSPNECPDLFNELMSLEPDRLMRLCQNNQVVMYHMDKETGRLTPNPKPKLCRRLLRKLQQQGTLYYTQFHK